VGDGGEHGAALPDGSGCIGRRLDQGRQAAVDLHLSVPPSISSARGISIPSGSEPGLPRAIVRLDEWFRIGGDHDRPPMNRELQNVDLHVTVESRQRVPDELEAVRDFRRGLQA
jgi:hypothetical protein